ncbi:hypothetical protein [Streptomyces sp. NPDC056194]
MDRVTPLEQQVHEAVADGGESEQAGRGHEAPHRTGPQQPADGAR